MSEGLLLPPDLVNVSNYFSVFNAHLLLCVDRQALPAASDLADFMLAKQLPVEPSSLQQLLQKLAKQNQWLRARELFKRESLFRSFMSYRRFSSQLAGVSLIRQTR